MRNKSYLYHFCAALCTVAIVAAVEDEGGGADGAGGDGPGFEKLDLGRFAEAGLFRIGRQQQQQHFKEVSPGEDGGGGGGGGGVGLIDALQRWADALEAQITLMRGEMTEMRRENRALREESGRATREAAGARAEVEALRAEIRENQGEMVRANGGTETRVEALRGDLRTFSESFSDFLGHYDKTMRQVRTNHSVVQGQLEWTKKSVKDFSSTLGDQDVDGIRGSVEELRESVAILSQADFILEERVRQGENRTEALAASVNKEFLKLRGSVVSAAAFREAMSNLSREVDSVTTEAGMNVTAVRFSVKALEQTLRLTLDDLTRSLTAVDDRTDKLANDLQVQNRAFTEDFMNFQKSIDFAKTKYDELTGLTEGLRVRLREHATLRQNLTTAMLKAMNELGGRIEETDARLEDEMGSRIQRLNASLHTFVGQVGAEVIKLHTTDEELNQRIEDLEEIVVGHEEGRHGGGGGVGAVTAYDNTKGSVGGSPSLRDRVSSLEQGMAGLKGNELPVLFSSASESRSNHSRLTAVLRGLERHFVEAKREGFEHGLRIASLNETTLDLGETAKALTGVTERLTEASAELGRRAGELRADAEELAGGLEVAQVERRAMERRAEELREELERHRGKVDEETDALATAMARLDDRQSTRADKLQVALAALANHSAELTANFSRMLVFAAANKAEVLELKVVGNTLEDRMDRLYDLHETRASASASAVRHAAGNITRLHGAADALGRDVDAMTDRLQTLEQVVSDHVLSAGEAQSAVRAAHREHRTALEAIKLDLETARAERSGVEALVTAVQGKVAGLTSNVTGMARNLTRLREGQVWRLAEEAREAEKQRRLLKEGAAANRRSLELADQQLQNSGSEVARQKPTTLDALMDLINDFTSVINSEMIILRANSSTLKANIVGLGNYINNINGDVGKLASTFEKYIGEITTNMDEMKENVTLLESNLEETSSTLRAGLSVQETAAAAAKGEIAALTSKTYSMKTTLFDQQNELSALRAEQGDVRAKVETLGEGQEAGSASRDSQVKEMAAVRADVSALRSGLTSLTNSMFNLKQQQQNQRQGSADAKVVEEKVRRVAEDVTAVGREVSRLRRDFSGAGAEVKELAGSVNKFTSNVVQLADQLSSVSDPPRFSCSVTSDEIRTSGVITYNICNVNTGDLMDRETGHVTVRRPGDYFVSFTANMVSVKAQAVWCALYKQSAGNDGWQVLGMINNYQRNGDKLDDRDSGSLSTITSLEEGDQIWVEWRGYGDSFLYSNPYRLISFTGFLLKPGGAGGKQ